MLDHWHPRMHMIHVECNVAPWLYHHVGVGQSLEGSNCGVHNLAYRIGAKVEPSSVPC